MGERGGSLPYSGSERGPTIWGCSAQDLVKLGKEINATKSQILGDFFKRKKYSKYYLVVYVIFHNCQLSCYRLTLKIFHFLKRSSDNSFRLFLSEQLDCLAIKSLIRTSYAIINNYCRLLQLEVTRALHIIVNKHTAYKIFYLN